MKYAVVFVLVFGWCLCFGQGVRFQLYRIAACKTRPYLDSDYALYKIPGSIDTDYYPKAGTVYLPGPGKYALELGEAPAVDTIFDIRDTGLVVFKYREPDVGLYYSRAVDDPPRYKSCGNLVQGYFEWRYPGGMMKMKGDFVAGISQDSMITFYPNEKTKTRWQRYSKYAITEVFDSTGNKLKIITRENGSFMTYHWRKITEFFPGGKVKLVSSDIDHVRLIRQYYPNGQIKIDQTKRHRCEYDENGHLLRSYVWKARRSRFGDKGENDFRVVAKVYGSSDKLVMEILYSCSNWGMYPPSFKLDKTDSIDINSVATYKNGRVTSKITDVSTTVYIEKYSSSAAGFEDEGW